MRPIIAISILAGQDSTHILGNKQYYSTLHGNQDYLRLVVYFVLLWISVFTIHTCHIEDSSSLTKISGIMIAGSLINLLLPLRYRSYLLPILFVGCCFMIFKAKLAVKLVAVIFGVLTLVIAPYNKRIKIWLIVLLFIAVIVWRLFASAGFHSIYLSISNIVGVIFMLRVISYLYEISVADDNTPLTQRASYFLLPPNLALPVFPVIDFKLFVRSYYQQPVVQIFEKGLNWIMLGVIQYLLYKFLYYNFAVAPSHIYSLLDLLQFLLVQFLYVLRILGLFHISLGLVCLYGYDLPEIFNHLFIANSFTDLWKRINIYWKEFVVKIFFYPIYFRIRKTRISYKLFLTTLFCFFISWQLHSWQWFWIKGYFPVETVDAVFWLIFGVLVAVEAEIQNNATPDLNKPNTRTALVNGAKSVGVLLVMCLLWSIWVSPSLEVWWGIFANISTSPTDALKVAAALAVWFGVVFIYYQLQILKPSESYTKYLLPAAFISVLLVFHTRIHLLAESVLPVNLSEVKTTQLNKVDLEFEENSYYDNLLSGKDFANNKKLTSNKQEGKWSAQVYPLICEKTNSFLGTEFKPNQYLEHKGSIIATNEWAMRDQPYRKEKPDTVYRIAIVGGSYEMGQGVSNEDIFEAVAENKLASTSLYNTAGKKMKVELLNFSVEGYKLPKVLPVLQQKAILFRPDALVFFRYTQDKERLVSKLSRGLNRSDAVLDSFLQQLFDKNKLSKKMSEKTISNTLNAEFDNMNHWYYSRIQNYCKQNNIAPVSVFMPVLRDTFSVIEYEYLRALSNQYGFEFADMKDAYGTRNHNQLSLSNTDIHPNKTGHELLADKFYDVIIEHLQKHGISPQNKNAPPKAERSEKDK